MNVKYLLKQAFWMYFFTYLAAPLGYLIRILYARNFSIEEFGLIYSIIGIIGMISIFNDLGFTDTLNYYATRFYEKKQYSKVKGALIFAFLMQGGTALLLMSILYFLSPFLADNYFKTEIAVSTFRWFLLYLLFYNFSRPIIQLFMATHNYFKSNFAEFLKNAIILVLSGLFIFNPILKNINYVAIVFAFAYLFLLIYFYLIAKRDFSVIFAVKADLSFKLYKKLFKYAYIVMIGGGALILLSRIDILLLTYFKGLKDVGIYSVALSLATIISTLFLPIIGMIFPLTSKLNVYKDKKPIKRLINVMYRSGVYLILPFLLIFIIYPSEIINLLFGPKYLSAKMPLIVLAISYFISILNGFNLSISAGLKLIKQRTKIMYAGAITNLLLGIVFIPIYGIVGAAVTTLFSVIIMFIFSFILIKDKLSLRLNKSILFKILSLNILLLVVVTILKRVITTNLFVEASIIILIVGPIYLFCGKYFGIIDLKKTFKEIKYAN